MLNPYFAGEAKALDQELYLLNDIIIEGIQIYGLEVRYIPRSDGKFDDILGEDARPEFGTAIPIEMYLETNKGPEGNGDVFTKFGLDIQDSFTLTVSVMRWDKAIAPSYPDLKRPREGDLLFINNGNLWDPNFDLMEIKWVEHEAPFFQLGRHTMYKLSAEKFRFSNQKFNTGIPVVDNYQYTVGTNKTLFSIQAEDGGRVLLESGHAITYDTPWQNETTQDNMIGDQSIQRTFGDNDLLQESIEGLVEFNVDNPFGEKF